MLKEYTLKVTCEIGGETEAQCDESLEEFMNMLTNFTSHEITHEEVVGVDDPTRDSGGKM